MASTSTLTRPATPRTDRAHKSAIQLLAQSAGSSRDMLAKMIRLFRGLSTYTNSRELNRRLELLRSKGYITEIPNRVQLFFGGFDMLRFFISPGANDYVTSQGLNFAFHQVLRILDEPFSMVDPIGVLSTRDNIIGHVMQVVHADASYDMVLLEMFEDGLEQMEQQTRALIEGVHPRSQSINAIIEDPNYHEQLLEYVKAWRAGNRKATLVRKNVDQLAARDPEYALASKQFADLSSAFRYFNRLPRNFLSGFKHFMTHRRIDRQMLDADL